MEESLVTKANCNFPDKKTRSFKPPKLWALKSLQTSYNSPKKAKSKVESKIKICNHIRRVTQLVSFSEIAGAQVSAPTSPGKDDDIEEMENKEYYNYMKKYSTKQFTAKHTFNSDDDSDKFRTLLVRHFLSTMDDLKSDYVYIPDMPYDYFDDVFAEHIDDPAVMRIEALYEVGYFYDSTGAKCCTNSLILCAKHKLLLNLTAQTKSVKLTCRKYTDEDIFRNRHGFAIHIGQPV